MPSPDRILVCDSSKCSGCYSCQIWCSFKYNQQCNPSLARLMIIPSHENWSFTLVVCRHCDDAPCLEQCPVDAIERDNKTGAIVIDAEKCTNCQVCIDACPYGVIMVDPEGNVFKCDLCGGSPVCVENCTRQALTYIIPTDTYIDQATDVGSRTVETE